MYNIILNYYQFHLLAKFLTCIFWPLYAIIRSESLTAAIWYIFSTVVRWMMVTLKLNIFFLFYFQVPSICTGDCLYEAVIHSLHAPNWHTSYQLRLQVVQYMVDHKDRAIVPLKKEMHARKISYYHLCLLTLKPGEWAGEEVLHCLRFKFNLKVTIIHPTTVEKIYHMAAVRESDLIIAYNGQNHYTPIGTYANR